MKFAVIISKQDIAGMSILKKLKHIYPSIDVHVTSKDSIYSENIDKEINADFIIFATKHKSEKGTASLSVHAPGNWNKADFGGQDGKVCSTSAQALKFLFQKLNENAKDLSGYEITLECTHHGPLVSKPCAFIEIGSNEKQWKDAGAAEVIAKTIADFENFNPNKQLKTAIAIGGPHYCPNFNKIQLSEKSGVAIGHTIPEYSLPLTKEMIDEAISKTQEKVDLVLLDWKGCGKSAERQAVIEILDKKGIEYVRSEKIEK